MAKSNKPKKVSPKKQLRAKPNPRRAANIPSGPVTLEEARALVRARSPRRALRAPGQPIPAASPKSVGVEREKLEQERQKEQERRIREYKATLEIMKARGVKGLTQKSTQQGRRRAVTVAGGTPPKRTPTIQPLQIFAEGDSWFDYPYPLFGGGIIPRLEDRLGVPILNLAKAGDEVRYMLGVKERIIINQQLVRGCPAGGAWDVMLFSGGGNDIVDNPMALWVKDYDATLPPAKLIHKDRFQAALALVLAGYEDLIALRDSLSPSTHLIFHAYDFAIPDGRGVCHLGPWLKPTFDLRHFPVGHASRFEVVQEMLQQFAVMVQGLASPSVTFINGQGTLAPTPSSWHNELHPSKEGFKKFAALFHAKLKALYPTRVL